jgi:hypothetical protein
MTLLSPEAFHFGQRHTLDTEIGQGVAYVIELEGLDDCGK